MLKLFLFACMNRVLELYQALHERLPTCQASPWMGIPAWTGRGLTSLEEAHLADLCQGHGDGVELVLVGAGDQGFF